MSTHIVKILLEDGQHVLVEAHDIDGVQRASLSPTATKTFESAWSEIEPFIKALAGKLVQSGPTKTQIRFGIKLNAGINAVIASSATEANFEVVLSWAAHS
jgi:hypothetical protein